MSWGVLDLLSNGQLAQYVPALFNRAVRSVNDRFRGYSPLTLMATTALAIATIIKLRQKTPKLSDWALKIPQIRKKYVEEMRQRREEFQRKMIEKWKVFGPPIREIPNHGMDLQSLKNLVLGYTQKTMDALKGAHFSGTIYSKSLDAETAIPPSAEVIAVQKIDNLGQLAQQLEEIFTFSFRRSYLWNSLHLDEFTIGSFLEYQVVQMVAKSFGGKSDEVMGFVTSGGSESLMTAALAYRNWGRCVKGHGLGESVIIAPRSIHAALLKAELAYDVKVVLVDTHENGQMDTMELLDAISDHGDKVVAIFASAPSYPKGKIDPIREIGHIALKKKIGFHVDCCLGAFEINCLPGYDAQFLAMQGVTSVSADTHKNGWAPKGSSVVVAKDLFGENPIFYSTFSLPDWEGGIYGTLKNAGSQSCVPALHAFLAMLAIGKSGYRKIAEAIRYTTLGLAQKIRGCNGLKLLGDPDLNVVAFQVDREKLNLDEGASYEFAHQMHLRKFTLNTLRGDAVHFCVTGRFAGDPDALARFEDAAKESLEVVRKMNEELRAQGKKFAGDAGVYCALESAMAPVYAKLSLLKYFENFILGKRGAIDAVKQYFLAMSNPYYRSR